MADAALGYAVKDSDGRVTATAIRPESSLSRPSRQSRDQNQLTSTRDPLEVELSMWMQAAQKGDAVAYRKLLMTIQPRIRAIVRGKIHDNAAAAEDVVQNTLLSIHKGRATYRAERPFGPWMRAITHNSIIDHFRERKRRGDRETEFKDEQWSAKNWRTEVSVAPLAPELVAALAALPSAQREAVTLIQVKGYSVAEAALEVGISPGALKVRAHRGYRAMREILEGERSSGQWRSATPPPTSSESRSRGAG